MAWSATIGGNAVSILSGSLEIRRRLGDIDTVTCVVDSLDGLDRYDVGLDLVITRDTTDEFGGVIEAVGERGLSGNGATSAIRQTVSGAGYNILIDRRVLNITLAAGTLKSQLQTLDDYLAAYGVTLDAGQANGPDMPAIGLPWKTLREAFTVLQQISGWVVEIDPDKTLRMVEPSSNAAPFNVAANDTTYVIGDIAVQPSQEEFANSILLLAGEGLHEVTDAFTGDGTTTAFTLRYSVASTRGYVTVNGVTETLGDSGATWILSQSGGVWTITRSSAPTNGHAISIAYTAYFPVLAVANDYPDVASRVEKFIFAKDVFDIDLAQAMADAALARYNQRPRIVSYVTRTHGLKPGMTQTIVEPKRDLNGTFLITDVTVRHLVGEIVEYAVTLIEGTVALTTDREYAAMSSGSGLQPVIGALATHGRFASDVVANKDESGGGGGKPVQSALRGQVANGTISGPALMLGHEDDEEAWFIIADHLRSGASATRGLGFVPVDRSTTLRYAMLLSQHPTTPVTDEYYLVKSPATGKLTLGAPFDFYGAATGALDAVYANKFYRGTASVAMGEWTNYTPTWTNLTVGNGTVIARYAQIGTTIVFSVRITFGSTTSISGNPRISLPATLQTSPLSLLGFGDVFAYEDGVGYHSGRGIVFSSTEVALYYGASPLAAISATAPFTWATDDVLHIMGAYERT